MIISDFQSYLFFLSIKSIKIILLGLLQNYFPSYVLTLVSSKKYIY